MAIRYDGTHGQTTGGKKAPEKKPKKTKKSKPGEMRLNARLPRDLHDAYARTCEANGVSMSEQLRDMIQEYVDVYS
jgi:predicted HicB family RNase H-like nuclease